MSTRPWTFADFILHHAATRPEKPAVILADRVATYGMMGQGLLRVAARIRTLGLAPNGLVCITIDSPIRHMIVAAALFHLGHPVMSARKPSDLPLSLPVTAFLQGSNEPVIFGRRQVVITDDWFEGDGSPVRGRSSNGFSDDQQICRVDLSSGTTGLPKAISLTVKAFHDFLINYYSVIGLGHWDRLLSLPGLTSCWGFTLAAHVLFAGKTLVSAVTPRDTMQMISVYGVDALVASSQQLRELVRVQSQDPLPCPSLRVVFTAGSLLSRSLMQEARAKLCSSIINQYGSSEAGSTAFAPGERLTDIEGATGYVVPGAEVQVVDENDRELPPDVDGILRIRTKWQGRPFPEDRPDLRSDFRDGWFYPGDRGRINHDGLLILSGRTSQIINVGGLKLAPELIEEVLQTHPTVMEAAAFGAIGADGIEEICAVIVPRAPLSEQHIVEWSRERNIPITRVFFRETLPRTASGKIHRDLLKGQLTQTLPHV